MSEEVQVHIHLHLPPELATMLSDRQLLRDILRSTERLIVMSQTLSEQVDAANAALSAGLDSIQTDVTAIAAELQAAVPPAGSTISQAQVDALNAQVTRVRAVKTSLDALVVPPVTPPAPTP
jgi:hypothetical protein